MATEIERKFLVLNTDWRDVATSRTIRQGYLSRDPDRTVRVRVTGDEAFITIKGRSDGITRAEFEYQIPYPDAVSLFALCLPPLVEKTRHCLAQGELTWEIDEFHGANEGLIVAEIELPTADTEFPKPIWLGAEVSHLPRYFNSQLASRPFKDWTDAERTQPV
jgi:adenylate cyclase